ncbi:DUF6229 family protein [Dyella terrae]|uniref:DUF6229 family protein n=1 Tax=Dyella terrae TaxID=522259 RepID=UPI001EFCB9B8|nr:DUF6229 family protein [Dyella terrae]ULU24004.1 hypothetical protein DYST_00911 [Dyella terrae]
MQFDDIVSSWLNGEDSFGGHANPAGPLYIQGAGATEAALTSDKTVKSMLTSVGTTCSTCSIHTSGGGCACC